jgi:membrane associated rhomboid family serine protease
MGGLYLKEVDRIHEAWRLFSMTWLHAGVNHLLPTMLTLLFIGIPLEKKFGLGTIMAIGLWFFLCAYFAYENS